MLPSTGIAAGSGKETEPRMDALTLIIGIAFVALVGALASLAGADTRDGFDASVGNRAAGSTGSPFAL